MGIEDTPSQKDFTLPIAYHPFKDLNNKKKKT
jgi:hypothetical protein